MRWHPRQIFVLLILWRVQPLVFRVVPLDDTLHYLNLSVGPVDVSQLRHVYVEVDLRELVDGFQLNVELELLKPLGFSRLRKVFQRANVGF